MRGAACRVLGAVLLLVCAAAAQSYSLYEPARLVARPDYSLRLVFIERWRGDYYLGVDKVIPLDEYLAYQMSQSVTESWQDEAKRTQQQQELTADASGLIPDILLPKLPVFGEGSKIDISGHDRITLGGRQTIIPELPRIAGSGGLMPELKMEQQLAVTLDGTIGERTKVNIDHDSERQEDQNKIKLTYTGTEDDVVQSVELGNTTLSIPSTAYTGDLPAHTGLFGASAKGKVGAVDVYAIASREESQSQTQTFTGKRTVSVDTIYDGQYLTRRFYYIDVRGTIKTMRVYVDNKNPSDNQASYKGIATIYPGQPDSVPTVWDYDREPGDFDLQTLGKDYFLHPGNIIEFANTLDEQDVVGVAVTTDLDTVGGQTWRDSLVLKLIKPERTDSLSQTWNYEMRNVYALRSTKVTLNTLRILRVNPEQQGQDFEYETNGIRFTQILGLDPNGDGRVEYPEFDATNGLIMFPGRFPFDSLALTVRDSVIYRQDPSELRADQGHSYYMVAEYSSATESYYLGQPDITPNTEKVTVDGAVWARGTDYTVNYTTGIVSFIRALPANANISVTYEYKPLYSMSQKSLMGTRAEYKLGEDGKVGTSVFYRSEGIPEDRPQLGSEPFRRAIAEADASYSLSSNGITAFLDRLPLLHVQAPTSLGAAAEGAVSLPDPNTKGAAYLDDFEGTSNDRDVLEGTLWSWASVPAGKDSAQFAHAPLFWGTPTTEVRNDSVFGPDIGDEGDQMHSFLRVLYTPDDSASWAGIMACPQASGMNLNDAENLQMVLKTRQTTGTIHVSVGMSIDEDAPRRNRAGEIVGLDGVLNTEDKNGNGQLDVGEDVGLDTVAGSDSAWTPGSADDGNDDWNSVHNPMGTEGNGRLDGEDLDHMGFTRYNHYFECDIRLGDPRHFKQLYDGWQLCTVTLHDTALFHTVGKPKWEDIRFVRLWFDGFTGPDTLDLYSVVFTGSRWGDPRIWPLRDTTVIPLDTTEKITVTAVSKKTDTTYTPPFDLKRDASGKVPSEASLLFGYTHLHGNRKALVSKASSERDDYRDYSDMRIYVHDDGNGLDFTLAIGSDSANYYEYVAPVTSGNLVPGRDGKWYEFVVKLDSFPLLKVARDSAGAKGVWQRGRYRVLGGPSLAVIQYSALGVENPGTRLLSGGLWFDDLRLTAPRKEAGYGFQAHANLALSDFIGLGVTLGYSDPNFRRFSEDRGVKTGGFGTSVNATATAALDRLLPASWGIALPVRYSLSEERDLPKFSPAYPDLRLSREQAASQRSIGRSEEIAIDNIHKAKSNNKWLNYTLEGLSFSWDRRQAFDRASLNRDSSSATNMQGSYSVSPDIKVKLGGDNELSLFPQDIRFAVTDGRQLGYRQSRISPDSAFRTDSTSSNGLGTDLDVSYQPIEDLSFDYSQNVDRDLAVDQQDKLWRFNIGTEASRTHSFTASYSKDITDYLSPSIDFDGNYDDDRSKVGVDYAPYRNMNNSGDVDLTVGFDLPELLGTIRPVNLAPAQKPAPKPHPAGKDTTGVHRDSTGVHRDSTGMGRDTTRTHADTTARKKAAPPAPAPGPSPFALIRNGASGLSKVLDPIDFTYSISRSSDLVKVYDPSTWWYRLGFVDHFRTDSAPTSAQLERHNTMRVSSGAKAGDVTAHVSYEWAEGRNVNSVFANATTALDRTTTWPGVDLTLANVQKLFKTLATDSRLSTSFQRQHSLTGQFVPGPDTSKETLGMIGRTETFSNAMSPLVSWTTTWKKRISTTLSANYTFSDVIAYMSDNGVSRSITSSRTRGADLSLSYTFTAPQGLKLPFLKKVKFSSDLSLSLSLHYSLATRVWTPYDSAGKGTSKQLGDDQNIQTQVSASYRFSRSIEAGVTGSFSSSKSISPYTTDATELNAWVLFKF